MLRSILAAGAGLAALATTQPAFADDHSEPESTLSAPEIEFTEWKLDNGLRVIAVDFTQWGVKHQRLMFWIAIALWVVLMLGFAPRHLMHVFGGE